jgi:exosome complex component RRP42
MLLKTLEVINNMATRRIIPALQRSKILKYLSEGKRFDGRSVGKYRDLVIGSGVSKNAESAIKVKLGKTEVLVGVKLGLAVPYPDSPSEGTFMVSTEMHPMASNYIDRGIRESGLIDVKKLCISEGEKVWQVFVDIVALNDDGNLMDAAGLGAIIALGNARMPVYDEKNDKIDFELTKNHLPLNNEALSFSMTFHKLGDTIVADVTEEEESISDLRLTIAMGDNNGVPRITAMQKGGDGVITDEDMENILNLASDTWKELFPVVKKHVFE